jgi:hypothetical protein
MPVLIPRRVRPQLQRSRPPRRLDDKATSLPEAIGHQQDVPVMPYTNTDDHVSDTGLPYCI